MTLSVFYLDDSLVSYSKNNSRVCYSITPFTCASIFSTSNVKISISYPVACASYSSLVTRMPLSCCSYLTAPGASWAFCSWSRTPLVPGDSTCCSSPDLVIQLMAVCEPIIRLGEHCLLFWWHQSVGMSLYAGPLIILRSFSSNIGVSKGGGAFMLSVKWGNQNALHYRSYLYRSLRSMERTPCGILLIRSATGFAVATKQSNSSAQATINAHRFSI